MVKAQSLSGLRRSQEYLATGAVITAAGVMFMAGSLQLTQGALAYARWTAIGLAVAGVFLIGTGLGMKARNITTTLQKPKPSAVKAKAAAKAGSSTKRSGRKK